MGWLDLDPVTQLQISDSLSLLLLRQTVKQVFGVRWLGFFSKVNVPRSNAGFIAKNYICTAHFMSLVTL